MKKIVSLLLAVALLAASCSAFAETVTDTKSGFGGDVTVTVETDEAGMITAITAEGAKETESLGGAAIAHYNETVFPTLVGTELTSIDLSAVDTFSGATVTSNAVKSALDSIVNPVDEVAVLQAQLDAANQTIAAYEANTTISKSALTQWLLDRTNVAAASSPAAFLKGEENAPTDEELSTILTIANNYMWCHLFTAPHFIVIRDAEEQASIVTDMFGIDGDGTVTILVLADMTKDQEHHAEQYTGYANDGSLDMSYEHYWRQGFGIYEAGMAAELLNLGAISLGYRVRSFAALDLYNAGVDEEYPTLNGIGPWNAGSRFEYISGDHFDFSKYATSKDGTEDFKHWFKGGFTDGECTGRYVDVGDNLTLLCALVVGKIDETDAASGATGVSTGYKQNENFDFWDPQK